MKMTKLWGGPDCLKQTLHAMLRVCKITILRQIFVELLVGWEVFKMFAADRIKALVMSGS